MRSPNDFDEHRLCREEREALRAELARCVEALRLVDVYLASAVDVDIATEERRRCELQRASYRALKQAAALLGETP